MIYQVMSGSLRLDLFISGWFWLGQISAVIPG